MDCFCSCLRQPSSLPTACCAATLRHGWAAAFFNYQLNRILVFHSQENQRKTLMEYLLLATGDSPGQQRDPLAVCLWPVPSAVAGQIADGGSLFLVSLTVQTKVIFRGGGGRPQRKGR